MIRLDQVSGCGVFRPLDPGGCYCSLCEAGEGCVPDRRQVEACKRWLERHVEPAKTVQQVFGSYRLKHVVEEWYRASGPGIYLSNGAFITAAIELGFEAVLRDGPCINCKFKMKSQRRRKAPPTPAEMLAAAVGRNRRCA